MPKMIKQRVYAEFHAWVTPPESRPMMKHIVPPIMSMAPIQSNALIPSQKGVAGVLTFKKKYINTSEMPSNGRLI